MDNIQNIQWFPGHMTKTKRKIASNLKLVDAVVEIIDARVPISSRNPDLNSIIQGKPRVILLNKCDAADKKATEEWIVYFKSKGIVAIPVDCKTGMGLNKFAPTVRNVLSEKIKQWERKGMPGKTIKVMVVGIPNVGKSSFINRMAKKSGAKVEDRPGVTRGNQWFTIDKTLELLDTPGVLWPKFDDPVVGERLAFIGSIKDDILDTQMLAMRLLEYLRKDYEDLLKARYKLDKIDISELTELELLQLIGKKRGMLISGGEIDEERAAITVLDEFRAAILGKITLEKVETK